MTEPSNTSLPDKIPPAVGAGTAVLSFAVCVAATFQLLLHYAFSTMVDPDQPKPDYWRAVVRRFLLDDGPSQVFFITFLVWLAFTSLFSAVVYAAATMFEATGQRGALVICGVGGALCTCVFIGWLYSFL